MGSGLIQLHDSVEVSEQEEAAVWGMQATDENVMYVMDFSPERLKQAKWALVVKLSAVDEELGDFDAVAGPRADGTPPGTLPVSLSAQYWFGWRG
jgi:hypothetical protein